MSAGGTGSRPTVLDSAAALTRQKSKSRLVKSPVEPRALGGCNTPGYAIFLADLNITMYAVGLSGADDDFGRWRQRRRGLRRLGCAGLCRSMRQTHGFQESKRCADCADRTLLASSVMGEIIDL